MEATNVSLSANSVTSLGDPSSEFSSGRVYIFITFSLKFGLFPALGVSALCANIINILVFQKMGLSDGINQNFFLLSISDGLFAVTAVINFIAYTLMTISKTYKRFGHLALDAQKFYRLSLFPTIFPQTVSVSITVVIAVVRSCCVAMPLRVKSLFTAKRQLAAIFLLSGSGVVTIAYSFAPIHPVLVKNPLTNSSSIVFFDGIRWQILTTFINVTFFGGFITVLASLNVLWRSLRQAAKFRSTARSTGPSDSATPDQTDDAAQVKPKERQRDTKVVRTVALVSTVFIVTNVPLLIHFSLRLFLEGFFPGGKYNNVHDYIIMLAENASMCNAFVNIFIYIFNNTRYCNTFFAFFGREQNLKVK